MQLPLVDAPDSTVGYIDELRSGHLSPISLVVQDSGVCFALPIHVASVTVLTSTYNHPAKLWSRVRWRLVQSLE